jgi:hypothetical protein
MGFKMRLPKGLNKKNIFPWYKHWKAGRQRCNNRNAYNYKYYGGKGIKFLLSQEEIEKLWFRDKAWKFKEAQLSRKNHNKNYIYNNCYFLDKKENIGERNKRFSSKKIFQIDLKTNKVIKKWESAKQAQDILGFNKNNLTSCARGVLKSSRGFKWKFVI